MYSFTTLLDTQNHLNSKSIHREENSANRRRIIMSITSDRNKDDDEVMLPGFRFHPTDEELVSFYLRRRIENKQLSLELIKQIDIYKYDPWDLPTTSVGADDQEWYFFCFRGRKYRNSVRPNRVTGSGFWKATGIDKPIHSYRSPHECIGLKKSLVYYRGSAGKGTKTDWMMHEFRLPPPRKTSSTQHITHIAKASNVSLEAEVWTICRIFKRITSYKKYVPATATAAAEQQQSSYSSKHDLADSSSKTCSNESDNNSGSEFYVSFQSGDHSSLHPQFTTTTQSSSVARNHSSLDYRQTTSDPLWNCSTASQYHQHRASIQSAYNQTINNSASNSSSGFWNASGDVMFAGGDWDELRPVVDPYAIDCSPF